MATSANHIQMPSKLATGVQLVTDDYGGNGKDYGETVHIPSLMW